MSLLVKMKLVVAAACALAALALFSAPARTQEQAVDPARWGDDHVGKPMPEFYGGDECLFCHRGTVGTVWQKDPHFRTVRDKFQDNRMAPELESLGAHAAFKEFATGVDFVMGFRHMTRFLRRGEGGRFELLSVGMRRRGGAQAFELVAAGEPSWDASKFTQKCIGCHMTAVDPVTLRPFETFVGCESCHGPMDDRHTNGSAFMRFAKKARETPEMIASACGQCHLRGGRSRSSGRPYPTAFVSGDNLFKDFAFDFSKVDDPALDPLEAHVQRNIRDIVVKGKTDLTCLSCHRMHPASSELHRRRPRTEYCLTCHKAEPFKERKQSQAHSAVCEY
jgi:predicted CXXCH cytochrome family protein